MKTYVHVNNYSVGSAGFTFGQEGNEGVEGATVVGPAVQAQHRATIIRTPDSPSQLSPRNRDGQL